MTGLRSTIATVARKGPLQIAGFAALVACVLALSAPRAIGYLLIFLGAVTYGLRVHAREGPPSFQRLLRVGLLLAVAIGLSIPAAVGAIHAGSLLLAVASDPRSGAVGAVVLLVLLAYLGGIRLARRWPQRWGDGLFVATTVVVAAALRIAYVNLVDAQPVSDFRGMWRLCGQLVDQGFATVLARMPDSYTAWVHFERVLPFLLPMRALFGAGEAAYALPNVVLGLATSLLTFVLTRALFGAGAARVALVLTLLAVEPMMAAEIPTHDLSGAFFLLVALALCTAAWRWRAAGRHRLAVLAAGSFGVALLALDLQRSLGWLLLAVHTVLAPLLARETRAAEPASAGRRGWLVPLLLALVPVVAFTAGDQALRAAGLRVPSHVQGLPLGLVAATDSWGDGSYLHCAENYTQPYRSVSLSWRRLALVKVASDVRLNPGGPAAAYVRKARSLFDLGSQSYFYLHAPAWHQGPPFPWGGHLQVASRAACVAFLVALVLATLWLWTQPRLPWLALLPLGFAALLLLLLLSVGEIQPRYLYPLWYLGAIYVGALLGRAEGGAQA